MAHSKLSDEPSGGPNEKEGRSFHARSLKELFGLRFKTEQPSAIKRESLVLSERHPPLLFLNIKKLASVSSSELDSYGCELADALTGSIQPFAKGAISIIAVPVEQDKPDTWNEAAQAALEMARKTVPDSRLIMTAAKCQSIARAAYIALGLGAYMAGQRDLKKCPEREIKMEGLRDLKAHRDEICETFETLGRILYRVTTEIMDNPGRIFRQTGSQTFAHSGMKPFASDQTSARILCGKSTKDTLSINGYKDLAVLTFDDPSDEHEGIEIAVVLKTEAKEFQAFAEKRRLFPRKEIWIITNATGAEWMSPKSPVFNRREEGVVQASPPPSDPPQPLCGRQVSESDRVLRVILVGKTGMGKSSLMNSILGKEKCPVSALAVADNETSALERVDLFGRRLHLVDTPGLFDKVRPYDRVTTELRTSMSMLAPGPHAFVLVLSADISGCDAEDPVTRLRNCLGPEVCTYLITVITEMEHDAAGTPEDFERVRPANFLKLMGEKQSRCTVFTSNSSPEKKAEQIQTLLKKVENIIESENPPFFTNDLLEKMRRRLHQTAEGPGRTAGRETKAESTLIGKDLEITLQNMRNEYQVALQSLEQRMKKIEIQNDAGESRPAFSERFVVTSEHSEEERGAMLHRHREARQPTKEIWKTVCSRKQRCHARPRVETTHLGVHQDVCSLRTLPLFKENLLNRRK